MVVLYVGKSTDMRSRYHSHKVQIASPHPPTTSKNHYVPAQMVYKDKNGEITSIALAVWEPNDVQSVQHKLLRCSDGARSSEDPILPLQKAACLHMTSPSTSTSCGHPLTSSFNTLMALYTAQFKYQRVVLSCHAVSKAFQRRLNDYLYGVLASLPKLLKS